ncbi:sperm flagellar protein 1 [Sarcophilus harrisii]|uniref:sperm flagellar protein 1 n=1 Tax=Sarcophilus harrisii TaxID=9305 RepID=UPI001301A421|nr:sperm flagellar protein 1 [Sarcophilus harrisii]
MAGGVDEEILHQLYLWVDNIPLSRPKRNLSRDFSDGGEPGGAEMGGFDGKGGFFGGKKMGKGPNLGKGGKTALADNIPYFGLSLLLPWARQKRHPLESGHRARTSCLLPEAPGPGVTEGCLESPPASTCSGRTLSWPSLPAAAGSSLGTISRSLVSPCAEPEQDAPGLSRFPPCPGPTASPPPGSLLSCSYCRPRAPVQAGASSGQDVQTRG